MGAYAYATTVLSTHFIEGPCPHNLKLQEQHLSNNAKETIEWVKEACSAEQLHPVNPNLILFTDDTTLFVFEGAVGGKGYWHWKLIGQINGNASVCSDFEVGDDAENSSGLCVRLAFTFTATDWQLHHTWPSVDCQCPNYLLRNAEMASWQQTYPISVRMAMTSSIMDLVG